MEAATATRPIQGQSALDQLLRDTAAEVERAQETAATARRKAADERSDREDMEWKLRDLLGCADEVAKDIGEKAEMYAKNPALMADAMRNQAAKLTERAADIRGSIRKGK